MPLYRPHQIYPDGSGNDGGVFIHHLNQLFSVEFPHCLNANPLLIAGRVNPNCHLPRYHFRSVES
jgi:hypothetical protein